MADLGGNGGTHLGKIVDEEVHAGKFRLDRFIDHLQLARRRR